MTDDLRKLIEAVENGTFLMDTLEPARTERIAYEAFGGSVDAAIALCEALLPGWDWSMHGNGQATLWPPGTIDEQNKGAIEADMESQPARALLLAVLRAKLMEDSHE